MGKHHLLSIGDEDTPTPGMLAWSIRDSTCIIDLAADDSDVLPSFTLMQTDLPVREQGVEKQPESTASDSISQAADVV